MLVYKQTPGKYIDSDRLQPDNSKVQVHPMVLTWMKMMMMMMMLMMMMMMMMMTHMMKVNPV